MKGSPSQPTIERAPAPAGAALLVLEGELDLANAATFRELVEGVVAEGVTLLVLDVTETSFLDSTMLRELLRARSDLDSEGGRVVIAGAQAPVQRLLDLTGTAELFDSVASRAEAFPKP